MFYEIRDELTEIHPQEVNPEILTVGYISNQELLEIGKLFEFDDETIEASQKISPLFQTGVYVHGKYTFAELRIINRSGCEDTVSIFIKHNLLLIVDIHDEDSSTINSFFTAIKKYPCHKINEEKVIASFIESILSDSRPVAEEIHNILMDMEESIVKGDPSSDFNADMLAIKKKIRRYYNFYGQIVDIAEALSDNENDILNENSLIYISNLIAKVTRLRDDMNALVSYADHIQDAYATMLDQRMNNTMKVLTILTTIFLPLTIIVGWYGMNFKYMPELSWRLGYPFVAIVSILVIVVFVLIGKKKKWF